MLAEASPLMGSSSYKDLEKVLTSKGIVILTRKKIQEITSKSVVIESGNEIGSDCIIWTAGVKGRSINIVPDLERTRSDTIPVDICFKLFEFANLCDRRYLLVQT